MHSCMGCMNGHRERSNTRRIALQILVIEVS